MNATDLSQTQNKTKTIPRKTIRSRRITKTIFWWKYDQRDEEIKRRDKRRIENDFIWRRRSTEIISYRWIKKRFYSNGIAFFSFANEKSTDVADWMALRFVRFETFETIIYKLNGVERNGSLVREMVMCVCAHSRTRMCWLQGQQHNTARIISGNIHKMRECKKLEAIHFRVNLMENSRMSINHVN